MQKGSFTLRELAELTNSRLVGNPDFVITGFADLESAKPRDISFLSNPRYVPTRYLSAMQHSEAGAIFIAPTVAPIEGRNFLIAEDPATAFQKTIEAMRGIPKLTSFAGIHPSAVIHPSAKIGEHVRIGPNAVIEGGVVIGSHTQISAGCYIGPEVLIGEHCLVHPNVTIREQCRLGNRVVVQPGVVIGGCGFGFTTDRNGHHTRLAHLGNVEIGDDVEIGSNSVIDRARFTSTVVGHGSKVDSLVTVGHNVRLGCHNIVCGQTGIAGSTQTGDYVIIAGQVGIDGHLKIGKGVMISARSAVTKSLDKAGKYGGMPAIPLEESNRLNVLLRNIENYVDQIKELQLRLDKLESK